MDYSEGLHYDKFRCEAGVEADFELGGWERHIGEEGLRFVSPSEA